MGYREVSSVILWFVRLIKEVVSDESRLMSI